MTQDEAIALVASTAAARWDGWDIIVHKANPKAFLDPRGVFHKELGWGFERRFKLNSEGYWI
jgi:hypothetical protein